MGHRILTLALLGALAAIGGCVDSPTGEMVRLFPATLELGDAPGLDNRHDYEISDGSWDTPHVMVGDKVYVSSPRPSVDREGRFESDFNEPAPYTAGTPMAIRATIGAALSAERDLDIEYQVRAVLRSTTDPAIAPVELGTFEGVAEKRDGIDPLVEFETAPLPGRVDLWTLELEWTLSATAEGFDDDLEGRGTVAIEVPTLLATPMENAPRYKQALLWSSKWAAGDWDTSDPETPHQISERLTYGLRTLEAEGHSYGAFPRPPRDQIDDRVNVYLDFDRTACGEHRGILMALIEYHGIDARWVWFKFPTKNDTNYDPTWNTHYRTRTIAAVGREPQTWRMTNHIVVSVDDRIYDPTYTVVKDSWQEYEDWMFDEYCKKEETGYTCVPNPPGWEKNDGIHPTVLTAENYK